MALAKYFETRAILTEILVVKEYTRNTLKGSKFANEIQGEQLEKILILKFLGKNCPYDSHKILHSHSTPKRAPACAKASKSYDWNVRNIAKISPKMAKISPKTAIFRLFLIFSKPVHTIRTQFPTVILHHIRVLYVQWRQNRMAGM